MNNARSQSQRDDSHFRQIIVLIVPAVIFPETEISVALTNTHFITGAQAAYKAQKPVFAVLSNSNEADAEGSQQFYHAGCVAKITAIKQISEDEIQITCVGLYRAKLIRMNGLNPIITAEISLLADKERDDNEQVLRTLKAHARELFEHLALYDQIPLKAASIFTNPERSPGQIADNLAGYFIKRTTKQQEILETLDIEDRLEKVCVELGTTIEQSELEKKIRQKVHEQVSINQKRYYVQEQIRVLQEELGQDIASETNEIRERARRKDLPEEVAKRLEREVIRLEKTPPASAEISIIRQYIDLILSLPWREQTKETLDIDNAWNILNANHYGLSSVKQRIIEFLGVRLFREKNIRGRNENTPQDQRRPKPVILCLIGPPGVGKTSLGESIARAMGRVLARISLGGVHDEAEIRGHRRTYVGAMPGRIIHSLKTAGYKNPVILLDEIDKIGQDAQHGDPAAALLEALDPSQNSTFVDHFLDMPFDLSDVFFICTGNSRYTIPPALADRMEIIDIPGYTLEEKNTIFKQYVFPHTLKEHTFAPDQLTISRDLINWLIQSYTFEAGIRSLERIAATICRKIALKIIENPSQRVRLTQKTLLTYLGTPRFIPDMAQKENAVGLVNGLAVTSAGGMIMPIEVVNIPGTGKIQLTGRQGEIMRESAHTAVSYIRYDADWLEVSPYFMEKCDLHVHCMNGAIPKDGPSAGITIALAVISALLNQPIRADTAMTGELSLHGKVMEIGGFRDKALAAFNAGYHRIIAPAANRRDEIDIPSEALTKLEIIYVTNMREVVKTALLKFTDPEDSARVLEPAHIAADINTFSIRPQHCVEKDQP